MINSIKLLQTILKGGQGSGNWAHAGRPGKRGGSYKGIGGLSVLGLKKTDSVEYRKILTTAMKDFRKSLKSDIIAVAKELNYDPDKIKYAGQAYEFKVGNDSYTAAADYNQQTGVIRLFPGSLLDVGTTQPKVIRSLLAHEITHNKFQKYQSKLANQDDELTAIYSEQNRNGVPNRERILRADGDVRDPKDYKRFSAYILSQKLLKHSSFEVDPKNRIDEIGGVSDYSNSYWSRFKQTRNSSHLDTAVNETFAEIARLKNTDPKAQIPPIWEELYNDFINL
jgi:hypothetical protein